MVIVFRSTLALSCLCVLGACNSGATDGAAVPGDAGVKKPYNGIGADEILQFAGTEPFWGGQVSAGMVIYTTIENQDGTAIPVERFNGRGGLGYSGTLDGAPFQMAVTPGGCSDGMSDRTYPFIVTLVIADETRNGCGWSENQPFSGPENP